MAWHGGMVLAGSAGIMIDTFLHESKSEDVNAPPNI